MNLIGPWSSKRRARWQHSITKGKVVIVTVTFSIGKTMFIMAWSRISSTGKAIYGGMTHMEHWYWQISQNISRNKIDKMPTGILLVCIIGKKSQTNKRMATLYWSKRKYQWMNQYQELNQFADSDTPWLKVKYLWGRALQFYLMDISQGYIFILVMNLPLMHIMLLPKLGCVDLQNALYTINAFCTVLLLIKELTLQPEKCDNRHKIMDSILLACPPLSCSIWLHERKK